MPIAITEQTSVSLSNVVESRPYILADKACSGYLVVGVAKAMRDLDLYAGYAMCDANEGSQIIQGTGRGITWARFFRSNSYANELSNWQVYDPEEGMADVKGEWVGVDDELVRSLASEPTRLLIVYVKHWGEGGELEAV